MDNIHAEEAITCSGGNCCGGGRLPTPPPPANTNDTCHASSVQPSCCADCDDNDSDSNSSVDYCNDIDKCTEKCIETAAAIECSIACAVEQVDDCGSSCNLKASNKIQQYPRSSHGEVISDRVGDRISTWDGDYSRGMEGHHFNEACNTHLRAAMEKYASYLESARCICRSVLQNVETMKHYKPLRTNSGTVVETSSKHHIRIKQHGKIVSHHQAVPKDKCCSTIKSCDGNESISRVFVECLPPEKRLQDLEKGGNATHMLVSVAGMDCSGCANNLSRALLNISGVSGVKVTFINSVAEFDLNTDVNELAEVIRSAQKATGYKLSPFVSDAQSLDIVMGVEDARNFQDNIPYGVHHCTRLTHNTYMIGYDPCIIGARDVLARTQGQLAPPRGGSYLDEGRRRLISVAITTAVSSALTIPVVCLAWGSPSTISEKVTLIIELILATLVQMIAIKEFYKPAISSLIYNRIMEMDMLVVISITAAYGYSVVALALTFSGIQLQTKPFFETSTLLITLILLGRLLAAWARKRAITTVSMRSLQASSASIIDQAGGTTIIDARLLTFGDIIEIQPYMQIVTDADVLSGTSEVDESMLTGESIPVLKMKDSLLISGTMNGSGKLTAKVSRLPGQNTITDIANLVEQAQNSKPRVQDLADRVAGYFIPVVGVAAITVLIIWIVILLKVRNATADETIGTAIGYCIAVLAISCPCALGLAVPMVLVIAGSVAARAGIIIKTADIIERGFRVTDVIFDKTGTLTESNLEVVQELIVPGGEIDEATARSLVLGIVKGNKHPVSQAVAAALVKQQIVGTEVQDVQSIPGSGVTAIWNNMPARVGNPKWLEIADQPHVKSFATRGFTMLCATIDGQLFAIYGLRSIVRPGAAAVVQELHHRGIKVHVVSGDSANAVQAVAHDLGINTENVAAEKTPAAKQDYVRRLMDHKKITLFCGDGVNDAVAIAQADIGVQIESSSDVTRATADVVLLHNLDGVIGILDVSKSAFRRIIFNFVWSAVYNIVAILLAAGAFVKVRIPPAYAGLGEIVSVLPVIIVALTMPKVRAKT